jgi:hypothetical protein
MGLAISKTKYLAGLQCTKLLWTHDHDRDSIPGPDAAKQAIFAVGHAVGDLAKQLYPEGIEVPWSRDLAQTTSATRELLPRRLPIFEASFEIDGCYCRADIMVPTNDDAWDLYEVKSATRVKEVNIADVAFQAQTIERSGVKLDRLHLMHIDNSYVRRGAIDARALFHAEDVTVRARELQLQVGPKVVDLHRVLAGACPDVAIGTHCADPYECDLWRQCSAYLPAHHVLELYRIRRPKAFALLAGGIAAIADLPESELSGLQRIQQAAIRSGQPQVARDKVRRWLADLGYPIHCFDFETMNSAVPLIDGTRPYQQVPFQFSLHIIDQPGAVPRHTEYLSETAADPRPGLVDALQAIGPRGTILAYNMSFERGVISKLAEEFPADAAFLRGLDQRFMDLMTPFSSFWYHDARQRGSCSLKDVLPALTGNTYEALAIADGGHAMHEFQRAVFTDVQAGDKAQVLKNLREYCCQDTQALVDILDVLTTWM